MACFLLKSIRFWDLEDIGFFGVLQSIGRSIIKVGREHRKIWIENKKTIENAARNLSWKKVIEKGDLAIWQKPINHMECADSRKAKCAEKNNADSAWWDNYRIYWKKKKRKKKFWDFTFFPSTNHSMHPYRQLYKQNRVYYLLMQHSEVDHLLLTVQETSPCLILRYLQLPLS